MSAKLIEECAGDVPGRVYIVRDDGTACMVWSPQWREPTGWIHKDSGPAPMFSRPVALCVIPESATCDEVKNTLRRLRKIPSGATADYWPDELNFFHLRRLDMKDGGTRSRDFLRRYAVKATRDEDGNVCVDQKEFDAKMRDLEIEKGRLAVVSDSLKAVLSTSGGGERGDDARTAAAKVLADVE